MKVYPHICTGEFDDILNNGCFVYLHGKIEEIVKFDIIDKIDPFPTREGIYSVDVIFNDTSYECTLYFWYSNNRVRGLVVKNDDIESIKYAKICYNSKRSDL